MATAEKASEAYPQEIEVTLKLKLRVQDAQERAYFLNADGEASAYVIADIDDFIGGDIAYGEVLAINDLTGRQVQEILNKAAGI